MAKKVETKKVDVEEIKTEIKYLKKRMKKSYTQSDVSLLKKLEAQLKPEEEVNG